MHAALPAVELKNAAKFRQAFSHFRDLFSTCHLCFAIAVQISTILMKNVLKNSDFQQFVREKIKFPEISQQKLLIYSENYFRGVRKTLFCDVFTY